MKVIYKYNKIGELVDFNSTCDEITIFSKLYINENKYYYNVFNSMTNLKEINYEELNQYKNNVIIYHEI